MKLRFGLVGMAAIALLIAVAAIAQPPPTTRPKEFLLTPQKQTAIGMEVRQSNRRLKQEFEGKLKNLEAAHKSKFEALNRDLEQAVKSEEATAQQRINTWRDGLRGKKPEEIAAELRALQSELEGNKMKLTQSHRAKVKDFEEAARRDQAALEAEFETAVERQHSELRKKHKELGP